MAALPAALPPDAMPVESQPPTQPLERRLPEQTHLRRRRAQQSPAPVPPQPPPRAGARPEKETPLPWLQRLACRVLRAGPIPKHVAFIMDGNRRFATNHRLSRLQGHEFGYEKARHPPPPAPQARLMGLHMLPSCERACMPSAALQLLTALEWCLELGVSVVTVYAFSIENFKARQLLYFPQCFGVGFSRRSTPPAPTALHRATRPKPTLHGRCTRFRRVLSSAARRFLCRILSFITTRHPASAPPLQTSRKRRQPR